MNIATGRSFRGVGGISFGTPYRTAAGVMLPVSFDVSGLKAITTKPRVMNSGLALKEIIVRRRGHTLGIALMTGSRRTSGLTAW